MTLILPVFPRDFKWETKKRWLDPPFAILVGLAGAAVRVRREERELHGRARPAETWDVLRRRAGLAWAVWMREGGMMGTGWGWGRA